MKEKEKNNVQSENPDLNNISQEELQNVNVDENISGTSHLNDKVDEDNEADKLRKELQEQKDKYLRLVAEFDNYKKRNARERIELMQTANKEVIISLLDVLDDCDRATRQLETSEDINAIRDGIILIFNKLRSTLQSKGLREMETLHADFDPDLHEAITEIPAPEGKLKGKIVDNLQKGYYLNDKIVRHAKVVVGK